MKNYFIIEYFLEINVINERIQIIDRTKSVFSKNGLQPNKCVKSIELIRNTNILNFSCFLLLLVIWSMINLFDILYSSVAFM